MVELKTERLENNLVLHYATDEAGNKYLIKQNETGIEYENAVDILPCRYTYSITDKMVDNEQEL